MSGETTMRADVVAANSGHGIVTIRCSAADAVQMAREGTLHPWLRRLGLETRTMSCRPDGNDLVYEGSAVANADAVTKDNRGGAA